MADIAEKINLIILCSLCTQTRRCCIVTIWVFIILSSWSVCWSICGVIKMMRYVTNMMRHVMWSIWWDVIIMWSIWWDMWCDQNDETCDVIKMMRHVMGLIRWNLWCFSYYVNPYSLAGVCNMTKAHNVPCPSVLLLMSVDIDILQVLLAINVS